MAATSRAARAFPVVCSMAATSRAARAFPVVYSMAATSGPIFRRHFAQHT